MNLRDELAKIWGDYSDEELLAMAKVAKEIAAFKPRGVTIMATPTGELLVSLIGQTNKALTMRMLAKALSAVSEFSEPQPAPQSEPGRAGLLQKGVEEDKGKHDPAEDIPAEDHPPQ